MSSSQGSSAGLGRVAALGCARDDTERRGGGPPDEHAPMIHSQAWSVQIEDLDAAEALEAAIEEAGVSPEPRS